MEVGHDSDNDALLCADKVTRVLTRCGNCNDLSLTTIQICVTKFGERAQVYFSFYVFLRRHQLAHWTARCGSVWHGNSYEGHDRLEGEWDRPALHRREDNCTTNN